MSTLTIDRPTSQADEPPCTNPWCTRHDAFGDVCTGRQARLGDHAAILTRGPGEGDSVYVSLDGQQSVAMTPAEAIEFARVMIEQARIALNDIRVGDRVTWDSTWWTGQALTGTVRAIDTRGAAHAWIDTEPGPTYPWKRTSTVALDKLARVQNAQPTPEQADPAVTA